MFKQSSSLEVTKTVLYNKLLLEIEHFAYFWRIMAYSYSSPCLFIYLCFFFAFQHFIKASDVLNLNEAAFKQTIQKPGLFLVEFFAPWCGHCKALAPEYETAATMLKDKGITLIQIDCTIETRLCEEYDVSGYPTLKIFRDGKHEPYEGPRKSSSIVSFMIKQTLPITTEVNHENYDIFKASDEIVVLALLNKEDKANDVYTKLATAYRNKFVFGVTSDASLVKEFGLSSPGLVIFNTFNDPVSVFKKDFEYDSLELFLLSQSIPLFGELNSETYQDYISSKLPLGCVFVSSDEEKESMRDIFLPFSKKYKEKLNIAAIDANIYGGHAENLNLRQEWPAFAIQEVTSNKKFPFDQDIPFTKENLEKFLDDYISQRLVPSIKSEPVPETQEGPVTVVVANNFREVVIESPHDVLVEFYAPWCGHCKNLAPKYEELARVFTSSSELSSKVLIAKFDATANDVEDNLDIKGFPTILLFPANDKGNPIEYNGPRTVNDLINFVSQKGSHKVDVSKGDDDKMDEKLQDPLSIFDHDEL
ncbi:protein disulfide-isomerase domain [Pneumocystis carinii B80]|uniref:Protein disulfide-isomerase n=1 Tax=Pneumocystis carinii (strain B80) TaxID=1408658 RepID=A0A0W4ZHE3_PNEC8|nr:protein disulfide-isomerase domain [Pneumocystis carinii B80]KTW27793.1 protein disulfide-isomerase domain [Pneumocystis carinii B80]